MTSTRASALQLLPYGGTSADGVVAAHVASLEAMDDVVAAVQVLTQRQERFALLLALSVRRSLDEYFTERPGARAWLRANRAAVGTWCRAVGYAWLDPHARLHNSRHLHAAPHLWATHVEAFACVGEARSWLHANLRA